MNGPIHGHLPMLTASQMAEVDRLMIGEFGIVLLQMMESAGRHCARLARKRFLDGDAGNKHVVILAGTGGNGGGAMVAARHLHNWGASVRVVHARPSADFSPLAHHQWATLDRMHVQQHAGIDTGDLATSHLIIDGLIGYSLHGAPRSEEASLITWANNSGRPVLSLDVPSGVDATTGVAHGPAIKASATLTLALPKTGLGVSPGRELAGQLFLADIGVPWELYETLGINISVARSVFNETEIVCLS